LCHKIESQQFCHVTYVKSSVVWGPDPVVRRCSPKSLTDPASRRPPIHTCYSVPIDVHPTPTSFQFRVVPIYLCVYAPIYIRCIVFTWHFYISEHYLKRVLRGRRPPPKSTRRRRHVELPNPSLYIPVRGTSLSTVPLTHRTNACLQTYTEKPPLQRLLI